MQKIKCAHCAKMFDESQIVDVDWRTHTHGMGCPHCTSILLRIDEPLGLPTWVSWGIWCGGISTMAILWLSMLFDYQGVGRYLVFPSAIWAAVSVGVSRFLDYQHSQKVVQTDVFLKPSQPIECDFSPKE